MTYFDKLKKLRQVSLAILILHIISILIIIITVSIMIASATAIDKRNMTSAEYNRQLDNLIGSYLFAWFVMIAISIANFILWIISMVQAFGVTNAQQYSQEKHGDLSTVKVLSVINGFTLGIGLFVAVNNAYKKVEQKPMVSNQKIEEIKESPKKATNVEDKIKKIDALLEKGVITKEEHKDLKKQVLLKDLEN